MSNPESITKRPARRSRNLVVLRAGDKSLHRGWIADAGRDFDLFISYFGRDSGRWSDDADYYEMRPGPKWTSIAALIADHPDLLERYDAFWFPDDDIAATTDTVNRMFGLFHGFALALAQPALTRDSYFTWRQTLQRPGVVLRYVAFVEVMAPIFDRNALRTCLGTFTQSASGWGLDFVWPRLAGRGRNDSIAIIDATPVRHTRALGGDLYRLNNDLEPLNDLNRLLDLYDAALDRRLAEHVLHGTIAIQAPSIIHRLWLALRKRKLQRKLRRKRVDK